MAEAHWTGPIITLGTMGGTPGAPDTNYKAGPNIFYQGTANPDVRVSPVLGGHYPLAAIRSIAVTPYWTVMQAVPAASAATPVNIAAAANTVAGVGMAFAAASPGVTTGVPFYPLAQGASGLPVVAGVTLDLGFDKLSVVAGSTIATPSDIRQYFAGQQIVIGGAGAGGTPLFATVTFVGTTSITLRQTVITTNASAPVAMTNIQSFTAAQPATGFTAYYPAGAASLLNPAEVAGRGVGIACSATGGGGVFTVRGYDIYGVPMSEAITHPGGAVVQYGRKAFKHIVSITPAFTDATRTYSAGTSDVLGFSLRTDYFEENEVYAAGTFITTGTGFTPADGTVATSTTGDVRGTVQIGTRGPLGTGVGGASLNGTIRIKLAVMPSIWNVTRSDIVSSVSMFGQTQA